MRCLFFWKIITNDINYFEYPACYSWTVLFKAQRFLTKWKPVVKDTQCLINAYWTLLTCCEGHPMPCQCILDPTHLFSYERVVGNELNNYKTTNKFYLFDRKRYPCNPATGRWWRRKPSPQPSPSLLVPSRLEAENHTFEWTSSGRNNILFGSLIHDGPLSSSPHAHSTTTQI